MDIRMDELSDATDRLLLEAQRAAARGDWGNAVAAADEAIKNDPTRAEAMYLFAQGLRQAGNEGGALAVLTLASKLEPKRPAIWLAMAQCMQERNPKEAYQAALKALTLGGKATEADTLSLLTNVSSVLGRNAEALDWAQKFEDKYGLAGEVSHNKSFALFALGRWEEAWKEFRASLGMPNRKKRNYHADRETPRWDPRKHDKATVVIYGEQGIGDEIMYASMLDKAIEAAEAKGSRVIIECYARNEGLFRRSFPDATVYGTLHEAYNEWPADEGVTHRLEMGGLGEYFAARPVRGPAFLAADPARVEAWAAWLRYASGGAGGYPHGLHANRSPGRPFGRDLQHQPGGDAVSERSKTRGSAPQRRLVGLAWTGGSWESGRARRSIPFDLILQLIRGQDATFVCLEYEDRRKDLEFAPQILNPHWATKKGQDMDELAAIVANLDLVISVQQSVVDLCGALGVPCWALADAAPQWRYTGFFGDDTMGFYESVKVYRQKQWGEWAPVIQRVAQDLKALTADKPKANGHAQPVNDGWVSC